MSTDAFHQHVDSFARTAEASFKHGETDLHAEHKEGCDQRPCSVDRIDDIGGFHLRSTRLCINVSEEEAGDDGHDEQHHSHPNDLPAREGSRTSSIRDLATELLVGKSFQIKSASYSFQQWQTCSGAFLFWI